MNTESLSRTVRRYPPRGRSEQPSFGAVAILAVVAAAGAAIVVRALGVGFGAWRPPHMIAFAVGALLCAWGLYTFQRGLRRQARLRAVADLLPHYRERMRYRDMADAAAAHTRRLGGVGGWKMDQSEWADEGTDAPLVRAEMRAATRALLGSLEDEIRQQASPRQRSPRPACRRARLRGLLNGNPGRVPKPSRDELRTAEPRYARRVRGRGNVERRRRTSARAPRTVS